MTRTCSPADLGEVAEIVRETVRAGGSITPRGGGSRGWMGRPPREGAILLDIARIRDVVHYEPGDMTITVQAGMRFHDLQEHLASHGQWVAANPAGAGCSTVGGLLASGASGCLRMRHGAWRDLVIGMQVVLADGAVVSSGGRVVKNVAGFEMHKLHVGALGTLGLIAQVGLKVMPLPRERRLVLAHFRDRAAAVDSARAIAASRLEPAGVEVFDGHRAPLAGLEPGCWLAVRLAGHGRDCARAVRDVQEGCRFAGSRRHRTLIGPACDAACAELDEAPLAAESVCRVSAPVSLAGDLVAHAGLSRKTRLAADLGNGIVHVLWDGASGEEVAAAVGALRRELGAEGAAVLLKASADARGRVDVWGEPPPSYPLMLAIKRALDPAGLWNPGRYVGEI